MNILPFFETDLVSIPSIQPEGWNDITPFLEFYLRYPFCHPIKAVEGNEMIGIGTHIEHNEVAWLGHIVVHSGHRNKGIGKLITETLVESAQKRCKTIYLIATDLGAPVYKKIGFEKETDYLIFRDVKLNLHSEFHSQISRYEDRMKQQVIDLDREVSGENRRFHIESNLNGGFVFLQNEIVEGYYLPSFGDGLIVAKTALAGLELMKVRLSNHNNASFPIDNEDALHFMRENHGPESIALQRMVLGVKRDWKPSQIFNRFGGNLG